MQSVETIIYAANELKYDNRIKFHIVGDGSMVEECKNMSDKMGLGNITFYGRQPISEMHSFYSMADAMLITLKGNKSLSYTVPGKLQSYMAAGKPIIGSINGETKKIINESSLGYCCDAEDYNEAEDEIIKEKGKKESRKPKYMVKHENGHENFYNLKEILRFVMNVGKEGMSIQRYKGLGEMNPEQLWETTMDPEKRTTLKVTLEDAVEADAMFTVLMGEAVQPRREFIEKHAHEVKVLDI